MFWGFLWLFHGHFKVFLVGGFFVLFMGSLWVVSPTMLGAVDKNDGLGVFYYYYKMHFDNTNENLRRAAHLHFLGGLCGGNAYGTKAVGRDAAAGGGPDEL